MTTNKKISRKELGKIIDEIQHLESITKIDLKSRDRFINQVKKDINLPDEILNDFSNKVKDKFKQQLTDFGKDLKIRASKLKEKLKKEFNDCVIINISTFSKQDALNIIQQLYKQEAIRFGKNTNHNNCYYEFIVNKDFEISSNYQYYVHIVSKKVNYTDILSFYNSLSKNKVIQKSGDFLNSGILTQIFLCQESIQRLKSEQGDLFFDITKNIKFSDEVRQQVSTFGDNSDVLKFILKQKLPIEEIDNIYDRTIVEYKEQILKLISLQGKFNINIDLENEYKILLYEISLQLKTEKERNEALIEFYLNSSVSLSLKTKMQEKEKLESELNKRLNYKKVKITSMNNDLIKVLDENNIYVHTGKNKHNKENNFIFIHPDTDINDLIGHHELKSFKGFIHYNK